jgi:Helix-turn-helix.
MTIYQLAETCNVPYQTLKSTEARHGQLKLETIDRICSGLDITLHDFFPEDQ